jgi:hypothetical protein
MEVLIFKNYNCRTEIYIFLYVFTHSLCLVVVVYVGRPKITANFLIHVSKTIKTPQNMLALNN